MLYQFGIIIFIYYFFKLLVIFLVIHQFLLSYFNQTKHFSTFVQFHDATIFQIIHIFFLLYLYKNFIRLKCNIIDETVNILDKKCSKENIKLDNRSKLKNFHPIRINETLQFFCSRFLCQCLFPSELYFIHTSNCLISRFKTIDIEKWAFLMGFKRGIFRCT